MAERQQKNVWAFDKPFAKAFPELADAVVEWEAWTRDFVDAGSSRGRFTMGVSTGYFQGWVRCHHPECQAGGFEIERIVGEMVQQREQAREGILVCPGWIGDRDQLPCVNSIIYRVELKYRARTPPKEPRN